MPDRPPLAVTGALPLRAADLRGLSQLGTDAVVGITDIVAAMHHGVASLGGALGRAPGGMPRGLTGLVYRGVRGTARAVGRGLDVLWAALPIDTGPAGSAASPAREAFIAALNGVFGDHLAATGNPLAIPMALRIGGRPWAEALASGTAPTPTGRLLVLVHGLGMNDLQWRRQADAHGPAHDHGEALARAGAWTPLYLHYNSGRHVSQNGRDFSALLDALVAGWPVPVRELAIVGHSMGGLVARSACAAGEREGRAWMRHLTRLVCLGTPHHGAPLERGGRRVDALLAANPWSAPLARLGRARSAGITDLRYGNLQDADWQHRDRHSQRHDDRLPTPLPAGVRCCLVAATSGATARSLRGATVGDGLVPLASALGEHRDRRLALHVPEANRLVVTRANHWDLLNHPAVNARLVERLA